MINHVYRSGGGKDAETLITRVEAKNENEKVSGVGEPDPFSNRISNCQFLKGDDQWSPD